MEEKESTLKDVVKQIDELSGLVINLAEATSASFTHLENEITGMKGEISGMKGEISDIKHDILGMKHDITDFKITQGEHSVKLSRLTATQEEHSKLLRQIKGDTEMLIKHDLNHEKRITKLEKEQRKIKTAIGI